MEVEPPATETETGRARAESGWAVVDADAAEAGSGDFFWEDTTARWRGGVATSVIAAQSGPGGAV